jgi:hypothetical protein
VANIQTRQNKATPTRVERVQKGKRKSGRKKRKETMHPLTVTFKWGFIPSFVRVKCILYSIHRDVFFLKCHRAIKA